MRFQSAQLSVPHPSLFSGDGWDSTNQPPTTRSHLSTESGCPIHRFFLAMGGIARTNPAHNPLSPNHRKLGAPSLARLFFCAKGGIARTQPPTTRSHLTTKNGCPRSLALGAWDSTNSRIPSKKPRSSRGFFVAAETRHLTPETCFSTAPALPQSASLPTRSTWRVPPSLPASADAAGSASATRVRLPRAYPRQSARTLCAVAPPKLSRCR